jgi:NTE family protein
MSKEILILSGGGIKGIAHLGALKILEEKNILKNIKTFVGSSIGSLICCLLNVGYNIDELYDFFDLLDFNVLMNKKFKIKNLITNFGFDSGKKLNYLILSLFKDKNYDDPTFNDLFIKTKCKLIITTTCVNDKKPVYFSVDNYPNMKISLCLLMSMAIPIYFTPILFENKYYIDGSCIDHYPIDLFEDTTKVIGIYLLDKYPNSKIEDIIGFLIGTYESLIVGSTRNIFPPKTTIKIPVKNISVIDFSITKEIKMKLFKLGKKYTEKFLIL